MEPSGRSPNLATAPAISFTSRIPANAAGWNNGDVVVNWSCTDATSGVVAATVSQTVSSEGSNQSSTGTCTDNAGLSASDTQSGINIDKTAPTLNPVVSPNPVFLNASASVSSGASDALSGLASQSCGALTTSSVGTKSVSCSATDNAGNSASASVTYRVIYAFTGFFSPVSNPPALNNVKAGSEIKLKFSLGGKFGRNVVSSVTPVQINCNTLAPIGSPTAVSRSELEYEEGRYKLETKSSKAWKNTCRQFTMTLSDGTVHPANFKFQ